jgi:hypothetical protein
MADLTFPGRHRGVVEDERPLLVGVAGGTTKCRADLEPLMGGTRVAVGTVAIDAAHPALQDRVVKGFSEVSLRRGVTADAEVDRPGAQQFEAALGGVREMALQAVHLVAAVDGLFEAGEAPLAHGVTGQTASIPTGPRCTADQFRISSRLHMSGPASVAGFALLGAVDAAQKRLGEFVARQAHLPAHGFQRLRRLACGENPHDHQ